MKKKKALKSCGKTKKVDNAGCDSHGAFRWCDMSCGYASFPQEEAVDGAGTCRTFSAIYCSRLKRYVAKNAPCVARHGARRPKPHW